jgi:hypothetical protein
MKSESLHEKSQTVGGRWPSYVSGRWPHYRRLSMYELIGFNGAVNAQVANFTGLCATFRFPTVKVLLVSELWLCFKCEPECVRTHVRTAWRTVSVGHQCDRLIAAMAIAV